MTGSTVSLFETVIAGIPAISAVIGTSMWYERLPEPTVVSEGGTVVETLGRVPALCRPSGWRDSGSHTVVSHAKGGRVELEVLPTRSSRRPKGVNPIHTLPCPILFAI